MYYGKTLARDIYEGDILLVPTVRDNEVLSYTAREVIALDTRYENVMSQFDTHTIMVHSSETSSFRLVTCLDGR